MHRKVIGILIGVVGFAVLQAQPWHLLDEIGKGPVVEPMAVALSAGVDDGAAELYGQGYELIGTWKPFPLEKGLDNPVIFDIAVVGDWLYAAGLGLSGDGDTLYSLVRFHRKTGQVEVLSRRMEFFYDLTGYIQRLLPYRGGVVGIGTFLSVDGRYARSAAYWDSTGTLQIIPMRGEGTRSAAAILEDTLYMEGKTFSGPGGIFFSNFRSCELRTMTFGPVVGEVYRRNTAPTLLDAVTVGKEVWLFGYFDEVQSERDTVRTPNAAIYNAAQRRWYGLQVDRDSFPTLGIQAIVHQGQVYTLGYSLDGQRHCYRIDPATRQWQKIPLPEHTGYLYSWFEHQGRLYAVFGGVGADQPAFIVASLEDTVWRVHQPFACIKSGYIERVVSDGRWWYIGGGFVMPNGHTGLIRVDPQTGEWEAIGEGVVKGSGDWWSAPRVAAMEVDGRYVYVGGRFLRAGHIGAQGIVRWDRWLQRWESLTPGCGQDLEGVQVEDIAVGEDAVYVIGRLVLNGRVVKLARYDKRRQQWEGIEDSALGEKERLLQVEVRGDSVYVLRQFSVGSSGTSRVRIWNERRKQWEQAGGKLVAGSKVWRFAFVDGQLVLGGSIRAETADGDTVAGLVRWDGQQWHSVGEVGDRLEGTVKQLFSTPVGLVAVGDFRIETQRGEVIENVALWTGQRWERIPGVKSSGITALAYQPDGDAWIVAMTNNLFTSLRYVRERKETRIGLMATRHANAIPPYGGGTVEVMRWVGDELWIGGESRFFAVPGDYFAIAYGLIRWKPPVEVTAVAEGQKMERNTAIAWYGNGIQIRDEKIERIEIVDLMGRVVWRGQVRDRWIPMELLSLGVYGYRAYGRGGIVEQGTILVRR